MTAKNKENAESKPEAANLTPEAQKILGIENPKESQKEKAPDLFGDTAVWTAEKKDCGKVWLNGRQVREMLTFAEKNSGKKKFVHKDMTIAFVKFCKE